MRGELEGRAPEEPPNGDFVAYLEAIERRQLAEMSRPHALAHPPPDTGAATTQSRGAARAPAGTRSGGTAGPPSTASLLMLIAGALALASALFGDGGIIAFVIGVALLWHPVRRIIGALRAAAVTAPRPRQAVDAVFGKNPSRR